MSLPRWLLMDVRTVEHADGYAKKAHSDTSTCSFAHAPRERRRPPALAGAAGEAAGAASRGGMPVACATLTCSTEYPVSSARKVTRCTVPSTSPPPACTRLSSCAPTCTGQRERRWHCLPAPGSPAARPPSRAKKRALTLSACAGRSCREPGQAELPHHRNRLWVREPVCLDKLLRSHLPRQMRCSK